MAFVAVTKRSIEQVMDGITEQERTERRRMLDPLHPYPGNVVSDEMTNRIQADLWGKYLHLREQMPEQWMVSDTGVRARLVGAERLEIYSNKMDKMPPGTSKYGVIAEITLDPAEPLYQQVTTYVSTDRALEEKYKTVRTQLTGFLKSCKSMNDALKQFPDLVHYLPDEMKNRINYAPPRKEKAPVVKAMQETTGFDSALITSIAVANALDSSK